MHDETVVPGAWRLHEWLAVRAAGQPRRLDDLIADCLITVASCPVNPHTSPTYNMPT